MPEDAPRPAQAVPACFILRRAGGFYLLQLRGDSLCQWDSSPAVLGRDVPGREHGHEGASGEDNDAGKHTSEGDVPGRSAPGQVTRESNETSQTGRVVSCLRGQLPPGHRKMQETAVPGRGGCFLTPCLRQHHA